MSKESRQKYRLALMIAFLVVGYAASKFSPEQAYQPPVATTVEQAFEQKQSNVQLTIKAMVVTILADDLEGSRHQKFIILPKKDLTLLVAHNIDLAPRINTLKIGDIVTIHGEYEWNPKGGIIHWTHRDPNNQHPHGWIEHQGIVYQ